MPINQKNKANHHSNQIEQANKNYYILYRAVGAEEFSSIIRTNQFSILEYGLHVKHFGLNYQETLCFANKDFNIDVVAIFEVEVIEKVLLEIADFTHVDPYIFRSGTVEIKFNDLSKFNNAIIRITHKS